MGRQRTRLIGAAVVAAAVSAMGVIAPVQTASAGCPAPVIAVGAFPTNPAATPATAKVRRGQRIVVDGISFKDGCADSIGYTAGCDSRPIHQEQERPLQKVDLVYHQGGRYRVLATADASNGGDFLITWSVLIPTDAALGPGELRAASASVAIVVVR